MRTGEHRFLLLADLHLSDLEGTAAHEALRWAVDLVNRERPDFLAVVGDVTTYGSARSAESMRAALGGVEVPVLFTPGNAELRAPGALGVFADICLREERRAVFGDLLVVCPDSSTGSLPGDERGWLERTVAEWQEVPRRIAITHFPLDRLEEESRNWFERFLADERFELLAAGHTHVKRVRCIDGLLEVVTRGLDPDKAIGDLPGMDLLSSAAPGEWQVDFHPWNFPLELLPADLPEGISPVGWSVQGEPAAAAEETLAFGLDCLELRPRNPEFDRQGLSAALRRLRDRGPLFLSYHLSNLTWNEAERRIDGMEELRRHLDRAMVSECDSLTMHVPRASAGAMERDGQPTDLHAEFAGLYAELFGAAVGGGSRLAIENLHNDPGTPVEDPERKFATTIDEYIGWLDAVAAAMGTGRARIGAHLDVGHARNNGGPLDNLQPLGDWYARLGRRILGYHIHQVATPPEGGRVVNHLEIDSLFGRRISYAGFLHAWSSGQITRGPLFIEVRDAEQRRRTAVRWKRLFEEYGRIGRSRELPDRKDIGEG